MELLDIPDPAIEFTVFGIPATKGNKSGFAVRKGPKGAQHFTGKVAMREGRSKNFPDWTHRVDAVVQGLAESGSPMLSGPLVMSARFLLPRPRTAPKRRTWPMVRPDLGKYLRAIEDPMNGVLITDDAQIVSFLRLEKDYAVYTGDERPRAEVMLWRMEDLYPSDREEVDEKTRI